MNHGDDLGALLLHAQVELGGVDENIVKPEVEAVGERAVEPPALGALRLARCLRLNVTY